jgi:hypothetical protein
LLSMTSAVIPISPSSTTNSLHVFAGASVGLTTAS